MSELDLTIGQKIVRPYTTAWTAEIDSAEGPHFAAWRVTGTGTLRVLGPLGAGVAPVEFAEKVVEPADQDATIHRLANLAYTTATLARADAGDNL